MRRAWFGWIVFCALVATSRAGADLAFQVCEEGGGGSRQAVDCSGPKYRRRLTMPSLASYRAAKISSRRPQRQGLRQPAFGKCVYRRAAL